MDFRDESSRFGKLPTTTSRNMSSSSSAAFFSANQSPFFSPRSPKPQQQGSESTLSDAQCESFDPVSSSSVYRDPEAPEDPGFSAINASCRTNESQRPDCVASTSGFSNSPSRYRRLTRGCDLSLKQASSSVSVSYNRLRCCDVFIGLHGRKPSLLRFAGWLRAELEVQGMSCFMSDRSRRRSARKCGIVEKAMDVSSFGVVILTRKSFKNPYTIEELRFFSSKKNLVPIFFDLSPSDCLVRDIVEKRGNLWEKHGGELWILYGGIEKEWKEAVHGLSRVDEWKLEAYEGNWRDCIFRAVTLLAMRLGRRSIVERLTKWRDKAEKEEFPYPRNENFIGREKELTKLEFILFGDITGDTERDYFELKARGRRKSVTLGWNKSNTSDERRNQSKKGKEKMVCKESEKEIEIQSTDLLSKQQWRVGRGTRRKSSMNIVFGKGVACVYGDSGMGKTELLLEFAYRYHQRYKMVLWIGGESHYIRQNYLNLWQCLEVDVGVENCSDKTQMKSFEEQEEAAISRIRKELMRNIPFLIVIDNLESEKDWWDSKLVMELLPRFGGQTHVLISTSLPRVMNIEPMELSFLSEAEALSLMLGSIKDYPISEIDALKVIEEKLGRLTLGLAIVGAILSELPINPTRLLDTINRMPLREVSWSGREALVLRQNKFLLQLFEVCFSIFDHAEGPRSLATRMVMVSGWFAPAPVPVSILALAAHKLNGGPKRLWRKLMLAASTCALSSSYAKRSEAEAASMLLRFNVARSSAKQGSIHFHELIKLYTRRRLAVNENANAPAMVQAVMNRGTILEHSEHIWAVCFLLFGFSNEAPVLQLNISELLFLMKQVILPLSIRTFITFSRCSAALELLRVCTNALEAADQKLVAPVEKWLDKSLCWRPVQTNAQINPNLWQELALARATVLETRAKLMLRGGQFGVADDLIRKAIFIRTSISGEDHPGTVSARETLSKLTRLLSNVHQIHNTSP